MSDRNVTVIINNRDLLEWPRRMCAAIEKMSDLHEIIIVDNGSTYRPLLAWYKQVPHKVIFLDNLGHQAPWLCGVLDQMQTDYYCVTDPDLDISSVPPDCLTHLRGILERYPVLGKVGLSLETRDIPTASPYWQHVQTHEGALQGADLVDGQIRLAPVDTTFAVYDRRVLREYRVTGARACAPYAAKHLPWYVVEPEGEFKYYLDNAAGTSSSYKMFTIYRPRGRLHELYRSHQGKVSTKWESYFPVYDEVLARLSSEPIRMLEIGVQNGGSLEIWSKYFPNARAIVGSDINPACAGLSYDDPRISVITGDAANLETYQKILQACGGSLDLVIDDGSHNSLHTVANFVNYFPHLAPGGIYLVEDMHCAYWPEYDGGHFNQRSAASFFKSLFDLVNVEHARADFSPRQLFQTFFKPENLPACLTDSSVYSVTAFNSVYLIRKAGGVWQSSLGRVVLAGQQALIDNRVFSALPQQNAATPAAGSADAPGRDMVH
jgi:hypothetical protein